MRVVPVIDLLRGLVVRGIAGRREEYRRIKSGLVSSANPIDVARAFRDQLGLAELYVADLEAIAGTAPAWAVYQALLQNGMQLWVDAGVRRLADADVLERAGVASIVVGLETVQGPDELAAIVNAHGTRVVFSLDLRNGAPLGDVSGWRGSDPWHLAEQAVELGVTRLLALDLARVGVNLGTGTEALCSRLVKAYAHLEVVAGGGVRDKDDLLRLRDCGVHAVLIASALHDGRITRDDLARLIGS